MNADEMRSLVAGAASGTLATINLDGTPALVPIVFSLDGDTLVTAVDGKPKETLNLRRIENIRRDPRAVVLVDHYADDWRALWWVRMNGRARIVEAGDELDRVKGLLRIKYPQYGEVTLHDLGIVIMVDEWYGWRSAR